MLKLQKICGKIIAAAGILVFGYLVLTAWVSSARLYASSEVVAWFRDQVWKNLLFTAVALVVCAAAGALADRAGERALRVTAAVLSLAVAAGCGFLAQAARVRPTADQLYVYEAAENFFTGNYTNIQTEWYFNACPYQLGLGLVYGTLMKMCGSSDYLVIQYAQAIAAGVTVYASFELAEELFRSKAAAVTALLCTVSFLPLYLYTLYLYGETFGVCFAMLGMLFWLRANGGKPEGTAVRGLYWILAGLCLALCYTARLALVIVMVAMAATGVLKALSEGEASRWKRWSCPALTLLLLLFALGSQKLSVAYMEARADVELAEGIPALLTVAMGIQDESENENGTGPGSYNAYNLWLYFESGFDGDRACGEALGDIKRSLYRWARDPAYMADYINRKIGNQWNEASYGGFCMTALQEDPEEWVSGLYTGREGDAWYGFLNLFQGAVYAMLLVYFVTLFAGRVDSAFFFLPALLLLGEFCFSVIWEAKSRYVYPYIVMALPCVAWSMTCCAKRAVGGIGKWRKGSL